MCLRDSSNIKGGSAGFNKSASYQSAEKTKKAPSEFLRPEFLNRADEIISFDPLPRSLFEQIVDISMSDLKKGLKEKEITLNYSKDVLKILADKSYSVEYGARNVRRIVQKEIEDRIVNYMCDKDIIPSEVNVILDSGEISIEMK